MTKKQLPKREDLLWPTLKALEALGGSASIKELLERFGFTDIDYFLLRFLYKNSD